MGWITGLFTLLGVALGLCFTEYKSRQERKERFRAMTFERRLETHQKAYSYIRKLEDALNVGNKTTTFELNQEALHWWYDHCFLLNIDSQKKIFTLVKRVEDYLNDRRQSEVWTALWEARKAVVKGIGTEHLPEEQSEPWELKDTM